MDFAAFRPTFRLGHHIARSFMSSRFFLYGTAVLAGLAACSSSSTDNNPAVTQHLYVGDDQTTGSLRVYALPLTANSTPVASIPMNKAFNIGLNATTLAVTDLSS